MRGLVVEGERLVRGGFNITCAKGDEAPGYEYDLQAVIHSAQYVSQDRSMCDVSKFVDVWSLVSFGADSDFACFSKAKGGSSNVYRLLAFKKLTVHKQRVRVCTKIMAMCRLCQSRMTMRRQEFFVEGFIEQV
jgi:hypothetical protein